MKALVTTVGTFGPFNSIETLADRYLCDGVEFQFSVVGEAQIVEADTVIWPTPPAPANPTEWLIDLGPFYDRFGAAKMAVLTSSDTGIKAIMADVNIRKWIDLQRADVAQALAYIGNVIPAVDAALQASILTTPVAEHENLALRKLYFS